MIAGLHHVQVACPPGGEQAARGFYGDLLGMTEVAKPAALAARGGVWFRSGTAEVHVGIEEPFRPAEKAHPAFTVAGVDGLDAVCARLRSAGVPAAPDTLLPGHRRAYVHDPFGNRLELLEPLGPE
ncbi:catechol 2,3-dioxygenase-like lactoylglutathione lyase family enzyme [Haloactinopolyspora alba]|uniref:Catechol 2,3-dioxygenase-like lactoylglutathione lyase family enzyme n=1 Tax=Haloactinopolyspora alba TaxID=648780 RepID=A0A2P8E5F8_9ACTN|nr:VOC family protein [Haloactinopolyspora alba]PSL04706.1 catechol 2,3-dioxygenase-like lactoylglutathione lyase family enzyme [Haloactinopolyspora alba]